MNTSDNESSSIEDRLLRLENRVAIGELIARYCFAIDARDEEALLDCFTEDIEFRRQDRSFGKGRQALWELLRDQLKTMGPTWHLPFNNLIVEFDGPASATSRHYGYGEHAIDEELVVAAMTYHHAYRLEDDGKWRMSRRAIDFWYFCNAGDLLHSYGSRDRLWWRGTPPPQLPFEAPTYQGFVEQHRIEQ